MNEMNLKILPAIIYKTEDDDFSVEVFERHIEM